MEFTNGKPKKYSPLSFLATRAEREPSRLSVAWTLLIRVDKLLNLQMVRPPRIELGLRVPEIPLNEKSGSSFSQAVGRSDKKLKTRVFLVSSLIFREASATVEA